MKFDKFALSDKPEERVKRELKAASAECTPISIDAGQQCGKFVGSSGFYNTWISECECVDFRRRGFPCKHMYRLAHELGLYNLGNVVANASERKVPVAERSKALEKCIELIDSYPEDVQRALQSVLGSRYGKDVYVCADSDVLVRPLSDGLLEVLDSPMTIIERNTQKRTVEGMLEAGFAFPDNVKPTKKSRYEWCIQNAKVACKLVYPKWCVVQPAGILEIAHLKAYTYLNRKFEEVYDVEW